MKVKIVGGFGGPAQGKRCTSILVDDKLLLDLGAASAGLSVSEKLALEYIFLSHVHLDHMKELPYLCEELTALGRTKVEIHCNEFTEGSLRKDVFNNFIFKDITGEAGGVLNFKRIEAGREVELGEYRVLPMSVNHPCDAYGFIVKKEDRMIVFTMDTGSCEDIWKIVAQQKEKVEAVFFDLSFPNSLAAVAKLSGHHTADTIGAEIELMPKGCPLYATHVKPNYLELVEKEVSLLGNPRLQVIDRDELVFNF